MASRNPPCEWRAMTVQRLLDFDGGPAALVARGARSRVRRCRPAAHDVRDLRAVEVEALAARDDGLGDLVRVGGGEHEDHVGRRLLEGLEQRVEGLAREHVDLVDDVHLETAVDRGESDLLAQVADVVDATVGAASISMTSSETPPAMAVQWRQTPQGVPSAARPARHRFPRSRAPWRGYARCSSCRCRAARRTRRREPPHRSPRRCATCARRGPGRPGRRRSASGTCDRGSASSDGWSTPPERQKKRPRTRRRSAFSERPRRAQAPGQATLRHMEWPAYRCFLPDLTGFAGFHCVGPDLHRRDTADSLAERPLGRGFSPAVADCGYRAPLAPRLARPEWMVRRGGERSKRAAARDHAARRGKLQTAARPLL